MNTSDIIVLLILAAALLAAGVSVWKNKGKGCGGNCGSCAHACGKKQ